MENVVAVVDRTEDAELQNERMERGVVEVVAPDDARVIEGISPLVRSNTVTIENPPVKSSNGEDEAGITTSIIPGTQAVQETTAMPPLPSWNPAKSTQDEEEISSASSSNGASSPTNDSPITPASPAPDPRKRIVIAGLGMVAVAFIEKLLKLDERRNEYSLLVLGEEPHIAYNRVGLTSYFEHREVERLYLNPQSWYDDQHKLGKLNYMLSTTVAGIDPVGKAVTVHSTINIPATPIITKYPVSLISGDAQPPVVNTIPYDILIIATGSSALAPTSTPGHNAPGVFLYRALGDLDGLITYSSQPHIKGSTGAVVGGGLLGLEAAKAMLDLANFGKVVIFDKNKWVLSRQLDEDAGRLVGEKIRELGVDLMSEKRVKVIKTGSNEGENETEGVVGVEFEDGGEMDIGCICYAIGIKPRDELARAAGLTCSERGGILVNDELQTSSPGIYAIGECASWNKETYGLIAPGVEMADILAFNLTQAKSHTSRTFKRPDLSTKLKLLGVDVASFGDYFADRDGPSSVMAPRRGGKAGAQQVKALTYKDPFAGVYKKYIFTADGKKLLGGMMIGDTRDYIKLVAMVKNKKELDVPPGEFILGSKKSGDDGDDADELDDDTQICSCHNVTKGDIVQVVKDGSCKSIGEVKACTKAGTGCAGCMPLVQGIFNCEMKKLGVEVSNHLCPHFAYSRIDLFNIISVKKYSTLPEVMSAIGKTPDSLGCEVCKPAMASIFASLHNHHVLSTPHAHLQDTNDKYLGNIQRNGTFSVVPRVAGGEITPDKLIVIGNVAKKYGLYCKITGGQRIDMFGARKQDLVDIWTTLVAAGMESGHAYAKSLRTIKSCVGTTWCRFGVGDSVGLAIRLENRYKSIRSPHKLKSAVSGCVRECAEAQNKDFGLIATDKGYNIYVGGNGGSKPRHGDLLIKDCPPDEVVPVLDRYLMFYIRTADKLQRTARWLEALPGGVKYLREVILEDKLGIAKDLEEQMSVLVSTYFCEWAEVVQDPTKQERFRQFANIDPKSAPSQAPATVTPPPESENEKELEARLTHPIDLTDNGIEIIQERGQLRPAYWPSGSGTEGIDFRSLTFTGPMSWEPIIHSSKLETSDAAPTASVVVKRGDTQLAIFHVRGRGYFASQQMCPHKRAFVLSDGLIGDDPTKPGQLWVSCPQHKRNFELAPPTSTTSSSDNSCHPQAMAGGCITDPTLSVKMFKAELRDDEMLYIELPPVEELDAVLGTKRWIVKDGEAGEGPFGNLDRKLEKEREERRRGMKGRRGVKIGEGGSPPRTSSGKQEGVIVGGGCGVGVDW